MRQIQYYFIALLCFIFSIGFYCTTNTAGTGHEGEAVVIGEVRDSTGNGMKHILVELLPADFNPVTQIEKQRGAQSEETMCNPLEDNKLWAYTNDSGRFEIDAVPAGAYTLIGIDYLTAKVIYHPAITVAKQNVNTGYDTAKTKGQILVTITDTLSIPSSYLYIPGTYYYNKVDSSGVNGIQAPAGIVRVNSYNTSNQRTDTLIDNAVINSGGIVDSSNSVTIPALSSIEDSTTVGTGISFIAQGSVCKNGHPVEYRFDWGDGTFSSPWMYSDSSVVSYSHIWSKGGTFWVHAQARCKNENYLISKWSSPVVVLVIDTVILLDVISTPRKPSGQDSIIEGAVALYMIYGFPNTTAEYRFDWGDSVISSWSVDTVREHSWLSPGVYQVRAEARKQNKPSVVSAWSVPLLVTVFDTTGYYITQPGYLEGPGAIKAKSNAIFKTGGSSCSIGGTIQYRFNWGDATLSPWITGDTNTIIIDSTSDTIFTSMAADTHFYAMKGFYDIRSQARSMKDTTVISPWTTSFRLTVLDTLDPWTVDTPWVPLGPDSLALDDTGCFSTGGGEYKRQNSYRQYRFDWGDSTQSSWSNDTSGRYSWKSTGTYLVRAQARRVITTDSTIDTSVSSFWSQPHYVHVFQKIPDPITTPRIPAGQSKILKGAEAEYTTGGTVCIHDNVIEYRFDWYGVESAWSLDSTARHTWYVTGQYPIRAQARSSKYPTIISPWSEPFYVNVDTTLDTISMKTPRVPYGPDSITTGVSHRYMTGGSHIWLEYTAQYRFDWGDSTCSSWSIDTAQEHSWKSVGGFGIRAQARKISDTLHISSWSVPFSVTVQDSMYYNRQSLEYRGKRR